MGTSASQNLVGRMADNYGVFRGVNLFLLGLGLLAALFLAVKIGKRERPEATSSARSAKGSLLRDRNAAAGLLAPGGDLRLLLHLWRSTES